MKQNRTKIKRRNEIVAIWWILAITNIYFRMNNHSNEHTDKNIQVLTVLRKLHQNWRWCLVKVLTHLLNDAEPGTLLRWILCKTVAERYIKDSDGIIPSTCMDFSSWPLAYRIMEIFSPKNRQCLLTSRPTIPEPSCLYPLKASSFEVV